MKKRNAQWIRFLFSATVLIFGVFLAIKHYSVHYCEAYRPKSGPPFTEGSLIIAAIEKYKNENGVYPTVLLQLALKYVKSIPTPNWGTNEWDYVIVNDGRSYALSVRLSKDDYICHVYEDGTWAYDQ